jgi:hypothetical protein
MAATPRGYIHPNTRAPKIVGLLNVNFACLLLLFGLAYSAVYVTAPMMMRWLTFVAERLDQDVAARKKADLERLTEDEAKATTDQEKETIRAKMAEVEDRPKPMLPVMDMAKLGSEPRLHVWTGIELFSGIALNVALLVSGVGLLTLKPWARKLAIGTAAVKIVRLTILYGYAILVIIPPMSKMVGEMVGPMMTQNQAAMGRTGPMVPVDMLVKMYTITYSIMAVMMIVFGSVYPALVLWFLTRPNVKAACAEPFVGKGNMP